MSLIEKNLEVVTKTTIEKGSDGLGGQKEIIKQGHVFTAAFVKTKQDPKTYNVITEANLEYGEYITRNKTGELLKVIEDQISTPNGAGLKIKAALAEVRKKHE